MAAAQERDFYAEAGLIVRNVDAASLATAAAGLPHAAWVTLAFCARGAPILLLSSLALHTRQLTASPECALLLLGAANGPNPQTTPRLSLAGTAARTARAEARAAFLARHPYAGMYADFGDFGFWEVFVTKAYFIGGFGAARELEVAKLLTPQ